LLPIIMGPFPWERRVALGLLSGDPPTHRTHGRVQLGAPRNGLMKPRTGTQSPVPLFEPLKDDCPELARDQENPYGSVTITAMFPSTRHPAKIQRGIGVEGREFESLPKDDCPEFCLCELS